MIEVLLKTDMAQYVACPEGCAGRRFVQVNKGIVRTGASGCLPVGISYIVDYDPIAGSRPGEYVEGDLVCVYRTGQVCLVEVGRYDVHDGQLLCCGADGKALPAIFSTKKYGWHGAEALEDCEAGGAVRAVVNRGKL